MRLRARIDKLNPRWTLCSVTVQCQRLRVGTVVLIIIQAWQEKTHGLEYSEDHRNRRRPRNQQLRLRRGLSFVLKTSGGRYGRRRLFYAAVSHHRVLAGCVAAVYLLFPRDEAMLTQRHSPGSWPSGLWSGSE